MNDTLLRIALLLIDTIIPISLGYILHKKGIVTQERKRSSRLMSAWSLRFSR